MNQNFDIIIVGGGAAGFFTAINIVEKNPKLKVAILERGSEVLSKVRISGGGRCNVTHACFEPNELVKFYPRGEKELRGPFHQFLISSFDWKMLEEVRFLIPKIRIGVLTGQSIEEALAFAKKIKAFSIHPKYGLVSKENVVLMQENGFEVYPWTVNAKDAIQKIKSFDVNGIISDFPDKI